MTQVSVSHEETERRFMRGAWIVTCIIFNTLVFSLTYIPHTVLPSPLSFLEVVGRETVFRGIFFPVGNLLSSLTYALTYLFTGIEESKNPAELFETFFVFFCTGFFTFFVTKRTSVLAAVFIGIATHVLVPLVMGDSFLLSLFLSLFFLSFSVANVPLSRFGITPEKVVPGILWGIGAFIFMVVISLIASVVISAFNLDDTYRVRERFAYASGGIFFVALVIGPIAEECFFRGWMLPFIASQSARIFLRLGKRGENRDDSFHSPCVLGFVSTAIAILVTSFIFSFAHILYGSLVEVVGAFVFGCILALVYLHTRTILAPIISHILYNTLTIIVWFGLKL